MRLWHLESDHKCLGLDNAFVMHKGKVQISVMIIFIYSFIYTTDSTERILDSIYRHRLIKERIILLSNSYNILGYMLPSKFA